MRQLSLKDLDSASWTQKTRKILDKYDLPTPYELLENPPPVGIWRKRVTKAVHHHWRNKLIDEASNKTSLRYLNYDSYAPGKLHHIWTSAEPNHLDIKKAQVKARLLVGRYNLQANLARYKNTSPTCKLCDEGSEDLTHFLIKCPNLQHNRPGYIRQIRDLISGRLGDIQADTLIDDDDRLVQTIMDSSKILGWDADHNETIRAIESSSRNLCYALHSTRSTILTKLEEREVNQRLKTEKTSAAPTSTRDGCTLP